LSEHIKGTRLENPSRRFPVQTIDFTGGERGTRTLDLGIMSAIWPFFRAASFHNLLISLDRAVQHFPLLSLSPHKNRHSEFAHYFSQNLANCAASPFNN
jgi:hypothetical protein